MKKSILFSFLGICFLNSAAYAEPTRTLVQKMNAIGNVKEVVKGEGGLNVWTLEKNGKTIVLYTTPDEKYFIKGTIYDVDNKKVVSDKFAINSLKYASAQFKDKILGNNKIANNKAQTLEDEAFKIGYMNLKYNKPIPEALTMIDSLAGAKEGNGKPQDTLYIIYDPRCPWCHKTYDALRDYVERGYTVKWIPTLALDRVSDDATNLAAAPLNDSSLLKKSFNKDESVRKIAATPKNKKDLQQNLQFLLAYFKQVKPTENPSVPIGFFLDKTTGKITDIQGIQEKIKLDILFGQGK